ncbi:MAG: hypothetical protein R3Y07_07200 [Eubacteriales bacterium]
MKNEVIYRAVGEIDPDLLDHFDQNYKMTRLELAKRKEKKSKQTWKIIKAAACCILLMGAGTDLVRHFAGNGYYEEKLSGGFRSSFVAITHTVYEEREDGFYYIFEGAELNITDYCSDTDYFFAPVLDAGGTGYIMVIGGNKGERGFWLGHYEQGNYLVGQWDSEIYKEAVTDLFYDFPVSPYPPLIWAHHAPHFLSYDLSEDFYQEILPDVVELDYGTANKIAEIGYHIEGYDLEFYNFAEMVKYVPLELQRQTDWCTGVGIDHPKFYYQEGNTLDISIYNDWSEEREAEVRRILDEVGFSYTLEFVET